MEKINYWNMFLNSLINNIPLILSSVVSIIAICISFKQNKLLKETETMKIYAERQFNAYCALLNEIANCKTPFTDEQFFKLLSASLNATVFSSVNTGAVINDFCGTYSEILAKGGLSNMTPEEKEKFQKSRNNLIDSLRNEIFRYEKSIS